MISTLLVAGSFFAADPPDFAKDTRPAARGEASGMSINGKSLASMRDKVKELWPTIVFEKDGKPVEYVATFETEDGAIEIEFFPKLAPTHVRSFVALVKAGYHDGLYFHRCIRGFMIQGGCPKGTGSGGPGYELPAEFNPTKHERGILSAARRPGQPDSASSQFFLCVARAANLDNDYSVFGKVTKGMDVVDKIVARSAPGEENPEKPCKVIKATVKIKGEAAAKKDEKKD